MPAPVFRVREAVRIAARYWLLPRLGKNKFDFVQRKPRGPGEFQGRFPLTHAGKDEFTQKLGRTAHGLRLVQQPGQGGGPFLKLHVEALQFVLAFDKARNEVFFQLRVLLEVRQKRRLPGLELEQQFLGLAEPAEKGQQQKKKHELKDGDKGKKPERQLHECLGGCDFTDRRHGIAPQAETYVIAAVKTTRRTETGRTRSPTRRGRAMDPTRGMRAAGRYGNSIFQELFINKDFCSLPSLLSLAMLSSSVRLEGSSTAEASVRLEDSPNG